MFLKLKKKQGIECLNEGIEDVKENQMKILENKIQ